MDSILSASTSALARAIRAKEVSSHEVVSACLERIQAVNPRLNAVVQLAAEAALAQARTADEALARGEIRGPLHGVPVTIKDSFDTAGVISTAGTQGRANFVPTEDAVAVARLRAAGAILLGKTNTPELTLLGETINDIYGGTNNPYDLRCTPGGSSGGAAAIIAAGGSPFDLGSDTAGSLRVPAHFCGIAALKPTAGRIPRTGHIISCDAGALEALTQVGPMARYVEDLILALPILAGEDGRDPAAIPMPLVDASAVNLNGLRAAFYLDIGIAAPAPETVEAVQNAARTLANGGAAVEEALPPGAARGPELFNRLFMADGGAAVRRLLSASHTREMSRYIRYTQSERVLPPEEWSGLFAEWSALRSEMLAFMDRFDLILCPASAGPAPQHGALESTVFSYTALYNLTGWPVVVVRAGSSPAGMPVGVQVAARPWHEAEALAAVRQIEAALGGWQPPEI